MDWAPGRIGAVAATADVEHRHESISVPVHCVDEHLEEPDEGHGCRGVAKGIGDGDLVVDGQGHNRVTTGDGSAGKTKWVAAASQNLKRITGW